MSWSGKFRFHEAYRRTKTSFSVSLRNPDTATSGTAPTLKVGQAVEYRSNRVLHRRSDVAHKSGKRAMNQLIYIVGAIVIVIAVLSFVGLR